MASSIRDILHFGADDSGYYMYFTEDPMVFTTDAVTFPVYVQLDDVLVEICYCDYPDVYTRKNGKAIGVYLLGMFGKLNKKYYTCSWITEKHADLIYMALESVFIPRARDASSYFKNLINYAI